MLHRLARGWFRAGLLVTAVLGLMPFMSIPATAGGPTSVLIVSPSTQTTASLYATSPDYELLRRALGDSNPEPEDGAPDTTFSDTVVGPGGRQVNVTWLRHDVNVWRVDFVVADAAGDVWVNTRQSWDEPISGMGGDGVWHRSPHPDELIGLLNRLDVTAPGLTAPSPIEPGQAAPRQATPSQATPGPAAGPEASNGFSQSSPVETSAETEAVRATMPMEAWPWAVPGVAAGVFIGVLGSRWFRRVRPAVAEPGPRQQLIDE